MRPPVISLYFFAAAFAFIAYGFFATREAPRASEQTVTARAADSQPPESADAREPKDARQVPYPSFAWRFNALDPGLATSSVDAAAFDPSDDYWGLPRMEGYDLVAAYCGACHSLRIVMQQHASEARWRELMDWMIEKQGMAPPPDDDFEAIIRYLSENF